MITETMISTAAPAGRLYRGPMSIDSNDGGDEAAFREIDRNGDIIDWSLEHGRIEVALQAFHELVQGFGRLARKLESDNSP